MKIVVYILSAMVLVAASAEAKRDRDGKNWRGRVCVLCSLHCVHDLKIDISVLLSALSIQPADVEFEPTNRIA